ncbi:FAD-dependent oxidoreductase [Chryseomicrobium palamuruense]|uniref:FAD-dependent oxidoreductase n=1 Tax=Chryseomicrobium palamuruense TaxID=682973 RepID=A0ABV8UXC3_9BACL
MKTIILVGAGHSHLHILREWKREPLPNCRLVLISPSPFQYYSGMISGFAEGLYALEETRVPLIPYSRITGTEFIQDTIVRVDAEQKVLFGSKGISYSYDLVSFDIGTFIQIPEQFKQLSSPLKPSYHMVEAVPAFRETEAPVVIGGGAAAVEMAFSIQSWRTANGYPTPVALISSSTLLEGTSQSDHIRNEFRHMGLVWFEGDEVEEVHSSYVRTRNGRSIPCTSMLWLTGPQSFTLFKDSGLAETDGFLNVNESLQSTDNASIFAAGDCLHFTTSEGGLAKNDVHAVKQGPVLWYNLQSMIVGRPLKAYQPSKQQLTILSLGNRRGLALYGKFHWTGRAAWLLKNKMDRDFMNRYR